MQIEVSERQPRGGVGRLLQTEELNFGLFTGFANLKFRKSILYITLACRVAFITLSILSITFGTSACAKERSILTSSYLIYEIFCLMNTWQLICNCHGSAIMPTCCTGTFYILTIMDMVLVFTSPDTCPTNSFIFIWILVVCFRLLCLFLRYLICKIMLKYCVAKLISLLYLFSAHHAVTREIPIKHATQQDILASNACSICLENFSLGVPIKQLVCQHFFHPDCIDQWLHISRHTSCPLCRRDVAQTV